MIFKRVFPSKKLGTTTNEKVDKEDCCESDHKKSSENENCCGECKI